MRKINYEINKYQFKEIISKLLECNNLSKIHQEIWRIQGINIYVTT